MVYALKDTNIQSSIMVTKSSNVPVATGVVTNSTDLSNLYMVSSVEELVSVDKIVLAPADNKSVSVYHVASIDLIPGASATINTTDGRTIVVDSSGIYEAPSVTPTGRRLLYDTGSALSSINSPTSNNLYSLGNSIVGLAGGLGGSAAGAITSLSNNITGAVSMVSNFATNKLNSVNTSVSNFISLSHNAVNGSNPCCGAEGGLQQAVAQLTAVYPNATISVSQVVGLVNQVPRNSSQICSTSEVTQLISTINNIVSNLNSALNQNGSNGLTSLIKPAVAPTQCCQNVAGYIGQLKTMASSFQSLQKQLTTACAAGSSG